MPERRILQLPLQAKQLQTALQSRFSELALIRTDVRPASVRRQTYLTNTCSLLRDHQRLGSARSVPFASPARSCCSRTTMTSTGRSTRTSGPRRSTRTERRCAGVCSHDAPASQRRVRRSACARSSPLPRRGRSPCRSRPLAAPPSRRAVRKAPENDKRAAFRRPAVCYEKTGGVLLSQALAGQVPSALRGLTSLFGMGRGVSLSLEPPEKGERPRPPQSFKTAQRHNEYQKIRQALDPLVPVSFRRCRPSRSGLSTWWSTRGLTPSRGWESSSRGRLPA
jgi:hypothetical protein